MNVITQFEESDDEMSVGKSNVLINDYNTPIDDAEMAASLLKECLILKEQPDKIQVRCKPNVPADIHVRCHTRRKPIKVRNDAGKDFGKEKDAGKEKSKEKKKNPKTKMDFTTFKLINDMIRAQVDCQKEKNKLNPNPEIKKASVAWQDFWGKQRQRRRPKYREEINKKKINKKKRKFNRQFRDLSKSVFPLIEDPDLFK